jgi:OPA family glycerol-3-phosphate transporter-like MFS transporter
MPAWLNNLLPILGLLVAVLIVLQRLPKVHLEHSEAFRRRRIQNWVPLGLTYAFLYFGRYNLSAIAGELDKAGILSKAHFNEIDAYGAWVYGVGFLINGPLTDRFGGRATMIAATAGSAIVNCFMAMAFRSAAPSADGAGLVSSLVWLNSLNMYFQSFGAVSIVKVNAPWFHVRERGVLGGLFGILISLGLYFSYDWSLLIEKAFGYSMAFWVPGAVLAACMVVTLVFVRDSPSQAGFQDFDTGDATSGETGRMGLGQVVRRMFSQRVIWIIVAIEFCSGFLRQSVMKQYRLYAKAVGDVGFVYEHWGMLLCVAGILGGVFAGFISDHVFGSRRGPVSAVLYGGLLVGTIVAFYTIGGPALAWAVISMSLCVIGVHGMLSGTASMDFGGTKNAGVVTGIIDGFVYLGTGVQAFYYSRTLPVGDAAKDPANWAVWPGAMIPVAVIGLVLCLTIWNARPQKAVLKSVAPGGPEPAQAPSRSSPA